MTSFIKARGPLRKRKGSLCLWIELLVIVVLTFPLGTSGQIATTSTRQVVELVVPNENAMSRLLSLQSQLPGFEIWSEGGPEKLVVVLVRSANRPQLSDFQQKVIIDDWDAYRLNLRAQARGQEFFASYHAYADYIAYLEQLSADFPELAQMFDVGLSVQGRMIRGIRISGSPATTPAVFFHGVQHGNEITNGPVLVFLADYLLRNYDLDEHVRSLVDSMEWHIVPIANPDGHEWGSRYNDNGADLNRDWRYIGYSDELTQPESIAARDYLVSHPNIVWHVDFHAGTQMILWPWGQNSRLSWDHAAFSAIAGSAGASIPGYATQGPIYSTIYPVHGDATDYVYGILGILSFSVEVSYSYAAPISSLPVYEASMRDFALMLGDWWLDCDGDDIPNPAFDCLRSLPDISLVSSCIQSGGPYQAVVVPCYEGDWDNDRDVDLRDVARWMIRFRTSE